MSKLSWQFAVLRHQLNWIGLVAIIGLGYSAIYYLTTFTTTQKTLNETKAILTSTIAEHDKKLTRVSVAIVNPTVELEAFFSHFPNTKSINKTWAQLAKQVEKSGLPIDNVHYDVSPEKHAGLLRYQLNIPVKSTYPQIRDFLAEVIESTPNIALEQLSFKRESLDSPLVDANINFVLYVKAE